MSTKTLNARDMDFILYEWLDACQLTQRPRYAEHSRETFDAALTTARQVAEKYFANHNRKGDENEPAFDGKSVTLIPEIRAACDGIGWTRVGMAVGIGMNVINALLNWMLIFGNWGFPQLGLRGAAISTAITEIAIAVGLFVWLVRNARQRALLGHFDRRAWQGLAPIMRFGWPVAVQFGFEMWAFQLVTLLSGWLGAVARANALPARPHDAVRVDALSG